MSVPGTSTDSYLALACSSSSVFSPAAHSLRSCCRRGVSRGGTAFPNSVCLNSYCQKKKRKRNILKHIRSFLCSNFFFMYAPAVPSASVNPPPTVSGLFFLLFPVLYFLLFYLKKNIYIYIYIYLFIYIYNGLSRDPRPFPSLVDSLPSPSWR